MLDGVSLERPLMNRRRLSFAKVAAVKGKALDLTESWKARMRNGIVNAFKELSALGLSSITSYSEMPVMDPSILQRMVFDIDNNNVTPKTWCGMPMGGLSPVDVMHSTRSFVAHEFHPDKLNRLEVDLADIDLDNWPAYFNTLLEVSDSAQTEAKSRTMGRETKYTATS